MEVKFKTKDFKNKKLHSENVSNFESSIYEQPFCFVLFCFVLFFIPCFPCKFVINLLLHFFSIHIFFSVIISF